MYNTATVISETSLSSEQFGLLVFRSLQRHWDAFNNVESAMELLAADRTPSCKDPAVCRQ